MGLINLIEKEIYLIVHMEILNKSIVELDKVAAKVPEF